MVDCSTQGQGPPWTLPQTRGIANPAMIPGHRLRRIVPIRNAENHTLSLSSVFTYTD